MSQRREIRPSEIHGVRVYRFVCKLAVEMGERL